MSTATILVRRRTSLPNEASHHTSVAAVSDATVCDPHPEMITDPSSGRGLIDHVTVTGVWCQPLQSAGAGVHVYWMSIAASAVAGRETHRANTSIATTVATLHAGALVRRPTIASQLPYGVHRRYSGAKDAVNHNLDE
jgi:hypothetical protein